MYERGKPDNMSTATVPLSMKAYVKDADVSGTTHDNVTPLTADAHSIRAGDENPRAGNQRSTRQGRLRSSGKASQDALQHLLIRTRRTGRVSVGSASQGQSSGLTSLVRLPQSDPTPRFSGRSEIESQAASWATSCPAGAPSQSTRGREAIDSLLFRRGCHWTKPQSSGSRSTLPRR